jgi:hypothetical protein
VIDLQMNRLCGVRVQLYQFFCRSLHQSAVCTVYDALIIPDTSKPQKILFYGSQPAAADASVQTPFS